MTREQIDAALADITAETDPTLKHLKLASLVDSAGSKVTPQGGASTGFGGTAARPGASLLPWAAAAAAGVLAAAGGLIRVRRRRRPAMHAR